jgi:SAM-dependent methyltransferase
LNGDNHDASNNEQRRAAQSLQGHGHEGFIANWYARQTGKNLDEFKKLACELSSQIKAGDRVLEIAPGPGYLAIELVRLTRCRMIGLDISRTFVGIANANAEKAGVDICFEQGDAADMPYPANAFDFIVCRAAFKNFARPFGAQRNAPRAQAGRNGADHRFAQRLFAASHSRVHRGQGIGQWRDHQVDV